MASVKSTEVNAYIKAYPAGVRKVLEKVRDTIHKAAPGAGEAMKYGIPTITLSGNLVHFAAFTKHIGFYPTPPAIKAFKKELAGYEQSKGAIRFPLDKPIPYALIGKITKYRVKETQNG